MRTNPSPNRKKSITQSSADHLQCKNPIVIDWPDIIRQWGSSGVPQKEFCRQHAVSYHSFVFQRMQLKKARHSKPAATPRLLPVMKVAEFVNQPSVSAGFVVQWPNGMRLCVPPQADANTLGLLLSRLGGVSC